MWRSESGALLIMGNRIKLLRQARGLSQQKLADLVGTSFQQIARLENSQRRLAEKWLRSISKALKVSPADLLTPDDEPGGGTYPGKFIDDPEKLKLLELWDKLSHEGRLRFLLAFAADAATEAALRELNNNPHHENGSE